MTLSVVIPTWNETSVIGEAVARAAAVSGVIEVIVSDGGSLDATVPLATTAGARVVLGAKGRGAQLRLGAECASGDVIVLLHADTWLHSGAGLSITRSLQLQSGSSRVVGGAFTKQFRDAPWIMRGARFRSWLFFQLTGCAFGDQAIFVRRSVLEQIGGLPAAPLMEEFELCRKLRQVGRLVLLWPSVTTSARRFRQQGIGPTYRKMMKILWLYSRGTSAEHLNRIYEGGDLNKPAA